ncbi:Cullin-5 [Strongyloides ratti]|uniref:Cullin-5 n=1 Tax=Strongyloides ratti TaxID=34506 RepID=A0A090MZP4_STRRB|nr:Cullin-5 [Strongyloides ratti]CEF69289.1 Cullin-5 [Strongyloides ratti]
MTCTATSNDSNISNNDNTQIIRQPYARKFIDFDTYWESALLIVRDLMDQKNVSRQRWHELFSLIFNICTWDDEGQDKINKRLHNEFSIYVSLAEKKIRSNGNSLEILKLYIHEWDRFYVLSQHLPLPFKDVFIKGIEDNENDIRKLMYTIWSDMIFSQLKTTLWSSVEVLITDERNGISIDENLIIGVRLSFVLLSPDQSDRLEIYNNIFLENYLRCTEEFYKIKTSEVRMDTGIRDYLNYMNTKLDEEEQRARKYLNTDPESLRKLEQVTVDVLVTQFADEILVEVRSLIRDNDVPRLSIIYKALNKTKDKMNYVLDVLKEYITEEGLSTMRENALTVASDPEKFVEQLLDMYNKFTKLIDDAFCGDIRFKTIRDVAFKIVANSTDVFKMEIPTRVKGRVNIESRCPELLANYCDLLLRKSGLSKRLSSEEIDKKLNDLLIVLKYVNSKDIFIKYHKNHLSRRLIMEAYTDIEREEYIVNQFKECGMPTETIGKMYRMLQDLDLNKDFNLFIKTSKNIKNNNRDATSNEKDISDLLNVKILNEGAWGRGKDFVNVTLNDNLEEAMHSIESLYKFKHKGRKLNWIHQWSHGTMTFTSNNGKYDLDLSAYQMAVINCFFHCSKGKLSFEALKLATKLPINELTRTLVSLTAFPKIKSQVLLTDCESVASRNFKDETLFWINHDFFIVKNNAIQSRGKLNLIGRLQLAAEVSSQLEQDEIVTLRELRTQEAITKIMKMRKECSCTHLENEVVEMLKNIFYPNKKLIKEQIEYLINEKIMDKITISTILTSTESLGTFQSEVLWALIVGACLAFLLGFGMGANDVSNAFGTSVGSKVLTLIQAYILASIFETLGSILVGYNVTDSMRKNVIDTSLYADEPKVLLIGQLAILAGCSSWLIIATIAKWPVSTTQGIVGATAGMSLSMKGFNGIQWMEIVKIAVSWVASPLLSGCVSVIIYTIVDHTVLRKDNPFHCGLRVLPYFYFVCLTFNTFAVIYSGSVIIGIPKIPLGVSIGIAFGIGVITFLATMFILKPRLRIWIEKTVPKDTYLDTKTISLEACDDKNTKIPTYEKQKRDGTIKGFFKWLLPLRDRQSPLQVLKIFSSIQVFTACFAGFAHGANDVANAIAPLAALISFYKDGNIDQKGATPVYVLLFGVLAICVGLWVLGHRVIQTVGQNMSEINPASGFTIEFGAAVTALIASKAGIPISTTHCLVGSVVFVGMIRSGEGIDWKIFKGIVFSWIITLPTCALISAGVMRLLYLTL